MKYQIFLGKKLLLKIKIQNLTKEINQLKNDKIKTKIKI